MLDKTPNFTTTSNT